MPLEPLMHTQKKWKVDEFSLNRGDIIVYAAGTPVIARVPLRDVSINEQRANAHLISAAPDMLKCLLSTAHYIEYMDVCAAEKVHAAIAKATDFDSVSLET